MNDNNKAKYLLEKLVNFNTENFDDKPSGYTLDLLKFVQKYLKESGIKSKIHKYNLNKKYDCGTKKLKGRGILLTEINDSKKPIVLLEGHTDTVPIENKDISKTICSVKGNIIKGRGAVDMKGSIASMILTIQELSKNKNSKYQPVLLLTSDEEANNFAGIKYFLKEKKRRNIVLAICGEPTNFEVKTNFYGAIYIIIKFFGKSGHGAHNKKTNNAITNSVVFLNKLIDYEKKVCKLYSDDFGYSTMNIGVIQGGEKVNQIPSSCAIEFAIRTVKNNKIYEKLFNNTMKGKDSYSIEKVFSYNPISISEKDKTIDTLKNILLNKRKKQKKKSLPVKEFTEATFLNMAGIKTVVCGPGDSMFSHTPFESINIKDILLYKNVLKEFFLSL